MRDIRNFDVADAEGGAFSRRQFLIGAGASGAMLALSTANISTAWAETPRRGGVLRAGVSGGRATDSLDPASFFIVNGIFGRNWGEQLVELTGDGKLVPMLAEEWDSSSDLLTWTFRIRKGVEFHNGKEMTPADVVATVERHSDEKSQSGLLGLMRDIASVKANGQDVVFTLKQPSADFPYLLEDFRLVIQPNGGRDNPIEGVGTGPYKVTVNEPGSRHGGERFKNYWRDDRGFADQIEFIVVNDPTARVNALQAGQVDIINRIEPKIVSLLARTPNVVVRTSKGKSHCVFNLMVDHPPYSNNDLRLAIKYAVDREELVAKILFGHGSVGNDNPINDVYSLFTPLEQRRYDPDRAKFHFAKSGANGPLRMYTSEIAFAGSIDAAQLVQQSAKRAGIEIEIVRYPADGYWADVWKKQPFSCSYWNGRATQDQIFSAAYYSKSDWNDTIFHREDFDKLLLTARKEKDEHKRKEIYAAMALMIRDEGGVVAPMFNDFIDATSNRVAGWQPNGNFELMGGYALSKCWLKT